MALVEPAVKAAGSAALEYAALGWPVFPVAPRAKNPLTLHGLRDATTDPAVIVEWFTRWPTANVGIATGPPGPTVVDCDSAIGRRKWMQQLNGIGWASTPWSSTGGGGWHIYYSGDGAVRNRAGWLPKVDVRGVGGYVVAPPSTYRWGSHYEWVAGPDERELQPLPEVVRDALTVGPLRVATTPTIRVARSIGSKYAAVALAQASSLAVVKNGKKPKALARFHGINVFRRNMGSGPVRPVRSRPRGSRSGRGCRRFFGPCRGGSPPACCGSALPTPAACA